MTVTALGIQTRMDARVERAYSSTVTGKEGLQHPDSGQDSALPSGSKETYEAVLQYMQETIQYGRPTVYAAAAAASINLRTLQRHLATCGVTFEKLLDRYRHSRALEYLQDGDRSVTDIAFELGYSDSAHFTRAFRRWTGNNPREFQQSLPQEPGRGREG